MAIDADDPPRESSNQGKSGNDAFSQSGDGGNYEARCFHSRQHLGWSSLCAVLAACGGTTSGGGNGSGNSGGGGNGGGTQMQAGQWEFVVTPNNGSAVFYVEANLTASGENCVRGGC